MKSFLKYLCASFLALLSGMAYAQDGGCVTLDVSYSLAMSASSSIKGNALVTVQDNAYVLSGNGIEAYCDGTDVWMVDPKAKEVYIESAASATESFMPENAAELLAELMKKSEGTFLLNDGSEINIKLNSMKKTERMDISSFRPSYEFDASWAVVDLR